MTARILKSIISLSNQVAAIEQIVADTEARLAKWPDRGVTMTPNQVRTWVKNTRKVLTCYRKLERIVQQMKG